LPDGTPDSYSALVEPFAVGLHGATSAEVGPGDDVLVIGAGGVGVTTAVWARAKGASRVTVADPDPRRRMLAAGLGATDAVESVADADPAGYDAVIECVGNPALVASGAMWVRPRGRLVVSGACVEPVAVEPVAALLKELTLRFSVAYTVSEFREVATAFATGLIEPSAVLGVEVGISRLGEAFELVRSGGSAGRVLVSPDAA
jgi:(R,R)-butanediol dehydrogenase/meso-butanediol dehydrogenase/diacetyl reductase